MSETKDVLNICIYMGCNLDSWIHLLDSGLIWEPEFLGPLASYSSVYLDGGVY